VGVFVLPCQPLHPETPQRNMLLCVFLVELVLVLELWLEVLVALVAEEALL